LETELSETLISITTGLTKSVRTLDIGCGFLNCHYLVPNALHCDIQRTRFVDVICDIQNLPFKNESFENVYALHILEHIDRPIEALHELIRVARKLIEVEVPHRFSSNAKQDSENPYDRHRWSFRSNWFHKVLKNIRHHIDVRYFFPRLLYIHVWIYLQKSRIVIGEEKEKQYQGSGIKP